MVWLSLHIYYDGELDFLLIKGVKPIINKIENKLLGWFFIRYMEHGQHIRLRLKIDEKQKTFIKEEFRQFFKLFLEKFPSEKQVYNHEIFPNNSFHFSNYEPEIERYGGKENIEISELYFQYSSRLILDFIHEGIDYEHKILLTVLINYNLALVYYQTKTDLIQLFEQLFSSWLSFNVQYLKIDQKFILEDIRKIKKEAESTIIPLLLEYEKNYLNRVEDDFSHWRKQNETIKTQLEKSELSITVPIILESYIHMNNNRMGISNFDEVLVNYLLI